MHYQIIKNLVSAKLNRTFGPREYPAQLETIITHRVMHDLDQRMRGRLNGAGHMAEYTVRISLAWDRGELVVRFRDGFGIRPGWSATISQYEYSYRTLTRARQMIQQAAPWLDIKTGDRLYGDKIIELVPAEGATTMQRRAYAHYRDVVQGDRLVVFTRDAFDINSAVPFEMVDIYGLRTLRDYANRLGREVRTYARESIMSGRAPLVEPVKTHDTSASFAKFMEAHRIESRDATIDQLNVPDHGTLSSRTWGIEVESGGARNVNAPDYWDRKYDGSLESAYGEECDHDYYTSCECEEADNDEDCAEFVSPILRSVHSRGLKQVTGELADNPQNDTAGVHVHVGASDLTPKQIGGLVFAYQIIEPMLEPMYQRETREYCRVRPADDVARVLKSGKTATDQQGIYTGDRYHSVNLQSLSSHTTIEFRAMGPVYDYEYLIRWAYFCREMVNAAKAGAPIKRWTSVKTFADVIRIFEDYGSETAEGASLALVDNDENRTKLGVRSYQEVGV